MKKVTLTYGLIAGAIVAAVMFITMPMFANGTLNHDNGEWFGYTGMVIALSTIFFGVKSYRDNYANGVVTFWQAAKTGLLITLIASVMYGLAWEVCYNFLVPEFAQGYMDVYLAKMKSSGASEADLQQTMKIAVMYKNPVIRFGFTLMEILPVGIVITLLSAGLLRKKEFLATQESAAQ